MSAPLVTIDLDEYLALKSKVEKLQEVNSSLTANSYKMMRMGEALYEYLGKDSFRFITHCQSYNLPVEVVSLPDGKGRTIECIAPVFKSK